jgi:hypothetical protein
MNVANDRIWHSSLALTYGGWSQPLMRRNLPVLDIAGRHPVSSHAGLATHESRPQLRNPLPSDKEDVFMAFKPNYGQQRQDRERSKLKKAQARLDRQDQKTLERKEENVGQHVKSNTEGGDAKER